MGGHLQAVSSREEFPDLLLSQRCFKTQLLIFLIHLRSTFDHTLSGKSLGLLRQVEAHLVVLRQLGRHNVLDGRFWRASIVLIVLVDGTRVLDLLLDSKSLFAYFDSSIRGW